MIHKRFCLCCLLLCMTLPLSACQQAASKPSSSRKEPAVATVTTTDPDSADSPGGEDASPGMPSSPDPSGQPGSSDSSGSSGSSNSSHNSSGGSGATKSPATTRATSKTTAKAVATTAKNVPYTHLVVKTPVASGTKVYQGSGCIIDASHASEGYIMARYTGGESSRIKLAVVGSATYYYDLNLSGKYEVFPLQMGNGSYRVRFMQNSSGSKYHELFSADISVSISNSYSPYLYPNQFVWFTQSSAAVKKSEQLCQGLTKDIDKVKKIYTYVTDNIRYDTAKASSVKSGYLPNVDSTLSTKKGICFDYASLVAAMLRAQGIPTKLIIGEVSSGGLHAWNMIYVKNSGWIAVKVQFSSGKWNLTDSTFGASSSSQMQQFIANSSNYTALKWY